MRLLDRLLREQVGSFRASTPFARWFCRRRHDAHAFAAANARPYVVRVCLLPIHCLFICATHLLLLVLARCCPADDWFPRCVRSHLKSAPLFYAVSLPTPVDGDLIVDEDSLAAFISQRERDRKVAADAQDRSVRSVLFVSVCVGRDPCVGRGVASPPHLCLCLRSADAQDRFVHFAPRLRLFPSFLTRFGF